MLTLFAGVGVLPEPVVQLVLSGRAVDAGVGARQTVGLARVQTVPHVGLVVEVGHFPGVVLLVIVVCVRGVVGRCDALRVRCRRPVVEVHLVKQRWR